MKNPYPFSVNTLLKFLLDNVSDLVCLHKPDGEYLDVSASSRSLLGYSPEDLLGKNPSDFFHPEDQKSIWNNPRQAGQPATPVTCRYRKKTGGYIRMETISETLVDESGNITHLLTISKEVARQKQITEVLPRSEEEFLDQIDHLKIILDNIPDMVSVQDLTGTVTMGNRAFKSFAGGSDVPIIGKKIKKFFSGVERMIKEEDSSVTTEGLTRIFERSIPTSHRGSLLLRTIKIPLKNAKDEVVGLLAISEDITQVRKVQKRIREANRQYYDLIKNVPGIVFRSVVEESGSRYSELISDECEKVTGYAARDFLDGRVRFMDVVHPNDVGGLNEKINTARKTHKGYETIYRLRTKSGRTTFLFEKGVVVDRDGKVYNEGVVIDVTDKVKQEDRIIAATLEAEDKERIRISRELHDGLQQTLVGALINLESVKNEVLRGDKKLSERFMKGYRFLERGLSESRTIAHSLMPKIVEEFGVVVAVKNLISNLKGSIPTEFKFWDNLEGKRMPMKVELSLYRISQEAITNIVKYAEAEVAFVQIISHKDSIMLIVEDDGKGFDMNCESDGLGMSSMKSRASAISGVFEIRSAPGTGTSIHVTVPGGII